MSVTVIKHAGLSNSTETPTANAAGTNPIYVIGPKGPKCPYTPGQGLYIRQTTNSDTYRWICDMPMAAGSTEPNGYTNQSI